MAGHQTYEESIKAVYKGLVILAVITLVEVGVSLFGKGHIWEGAKDAGWVIWVAGLLIIGLSAYKAYFIIYDFMHMRYEMKGMAMSVLLPTLLLVWGIIAFMQEGNSWGDRRELIQERNAIDPDAKDDATGMIDKETISLEEAMES